MKRWDLTERGALEPMEETHNGDWVSFEDHEAEVAQLRGTLSLAEEGLANYAQENEQLKAERDWLITHAGLEWHGWWSQRIADTPEPLRSQMKAILYPDGYPSERSALPQTCDESPK